MDGKIILEGISIADFRDIIRQDIRAEILDNESRKANPLNKSEACVQLGISYKTLVKAMTICNLSEVYPADLDHIRRKCPELFRRAKPQNKS